jgi:hypothetical protein
MTRTARLSVALGALAITGACASTTPAARPTSVNDDFTSRIGNYRYEQAVNDLGPPAQEKELPTGETVCTWPRKGSTAASATYSGPPTSFGTTTPGLQDSDFVILTFDSRKVLVNCVTQPEKPAPDASW